MFFFEDVRSMVADGFSLDSTLRRLLLPQVKSSYIQHKPWTCVWAQVTINEVWFSAVGFSRQREYTSLLFCRRRRFPWFHVVLARRDDWCDWKGQVIALQRAIDNLVVNVTRAYRRWEEGKLWLKPKLSISELPLPEVHYETQVIQ